jgi:hypothetical protein
MYFIIFNQIHINNFLLSTVTRVSGVGSCFSCCPASSSPRKRRCYLEASQFDGLGWLVDTDWLEQLFQQLRGEALPCGLGRRSSWVLCTTDVIEWIGCRTKVRRLEPWTKSFMQIQRSCASHHPIRKILLYHSKKSLVQRVKKHEMFVRDPEMQNPLQLSHGFYTGIEFLGMAYFLSANNRA